MQKIYDEFKAVEHENYKSFHRNILRDDGVPKLKKTTFRMPGYRQILSDSDEKDYTINNKKVYDRHLRALQAQHSGLSQ